MENAFNLKKFILKLKCQLDSILFRLDTIEDSCCGGGGGGYEYFSSSSIFIDNNRRINIRPLLLSHIQSGTEAYNWILDNQSFLAYQSDLNLLETSIQNWVNQQGFVYTDTTYNIFNTMSNGLVPASGINGETKFLRGDQTWQEIDPDAGTWGAKEW